MHTSLSLGKYLPFALGLLLVFAACDPDDGEDDGEETAFERFDTDDSGDIDANEFGASFSQMGDFDADASGDLNQDEFNTGVFDAFDADTSGGIDEREFNDGSEFFGVNTF